MWAPVGGGAASPRVTTNILSSRFTEQLGSSLTSTGDPALW